VDASIASVVPVLAQPPWQDPDLFAEQIVQGIATGGVYALVALALVLIYRSTEVVNFAQGEMAMIATFAVWSIAGPQMLDRFEAWQLLVIGVPIGAALGAGIERVIIRPVENAPVLNVVVVTVGLFVLLNSLATGLYAKGEVTKVFPTPFGFEAVDLGFAKISQHHLGLLIIAMSVMVLLYLLFNHTKVGLAMRAAAQNPVASRLMGINVGRMLTLGWALSAAVGALAGMLIAPITLLHPSFMLGVLLYAFAAAVLGGLNSPPGAVLGGFLIGVVENLLGTYTPAEWFGPEMKLPLTLLLLVLVLLIRPTGLLGQATTRRV
jgi:branched-chain amino acid transport system permease protein